MPNYRITASGVGPWRQGDVITDADLKAHEGLGGVKRLRDQLGSIEQTTDKRSVKGEDADPGQPQPAELTSGNPLGIEETAGERVQKSHLAESDDEGGDAPNARGRRSAGKS